MTRQDLVDELLVERYRPVPPRPQDRVAPIDPVMARRNARRLDREVAAFEADRRERVVIRDSPVETTKEAS